MNILPHKSWHVRTKKNIARVRKDEAKAAEEEKEKGRRAQLALSEARTAVLRQRATQRLSEAAASASVGVEEVSIPLAPVTDIVQKDGHVNFFLDMEEGKKQGGINEEAEKEKKKEEEEYEKKIGYLVYLGQDSLEANKDRPWYAKIERTSAEGEKAKQSFEKAKTFEKSGYLEGLNKECDLSQEELKLAKFKSFQDPLSDIRRYLKVPSIKKKMEETRKKEDRKRRRSKSPEVIKKKKNKKKEQKNKKKRKRESSKKHKKDKHKKESSSSSSEFENEEEERKRKTLEKLRAERLQREREEKRRTEQLLAKLRGDTIPEEKERERKRQEEGVERHGRVKQKYNSQFNPELARQNYD